MAELEAALSYREWNMPPRVMIDMDPAPPIANEPFTNIIMEIRDEDWRRGYL